MRWLLDWRLRAVLRRSNLPDLPEVRRFMRVSYWDGFTFGALTNQVESAREDAMRALTAQ